MGQLGTGANRDERQNMIVRPELTITGKLLSRTVQPLNDLKVKLGGKVTLRKTGKTKVDSEPPMQTGNSAKRSRNRSRKKKCPGTLPERNDSEMAMKHKAYGTLTSSEMHTETVDQLVNLPWRAVILRHFEREMRTTSKVHALIAKPYVRTELQLRFALCMTICIVY